MTLTIALAKGRTTAQVLPLLSAAGIDCTALQEKSRRLLFTDDPDFHFVLVKAPDVLTYLNRGTVDIGIVGSDILEEQGHQQFDLLDLRTGRCRFILASTPDFDPHQTSRKRIATKYPHIAQRYFQDQGEDVEMIKIEGSVELAPLTGMADAIVDITETGTTLRENHLKVFATLTPVSTHLVVNRLALKQKKTAIYQLIQALKRVRPQEV